MKIAARALVALALAGVSAGAALADGSAGPGFLQGWPGVVARRTGTHYVAYPLTKRTLLLALSQKGKVLRSRTVRGDVGFPFVSFDGHVEGLSHDGRTLVLVGPGQRSPSRFLVLTPRLRVVRKISLRGTFSYDAMSPAGRTLYLIEQRIQSSGYAVYRVRALDVRTGRLLQKPVRDVREGETWMRGTPTARAWGSDGRWAYTLYQTTGRSFVHALDTATRSAVCIDLPRRARRARQLRIRSGRLVVRTQKTAVAEIDLRSLRLASD